MRLCEQTRNAISQTPLFTASQAGKLEVLLLLDELATFSDFDF